MIFPRSNLNFRPTMSSAEFGSTLFETSRDVLEQECNEKFSDFCKEITQACEKAAQTGAFFVECSVEIREDEGLEAVYFEKLQMP